MLSIILQDYPNIVLKLAFDDIIRNDSLVNQKKDMAIRGNFEIEVIQNIEHIIGRTSWDRSHIWQLILKRNIIS